MNTRLICTAGVKIGGLTLKSGHLNWEDWYSQPGKGVSEERTRHLADVHRCFLDRLVSLQSAYVIEVGIGTGLLGLSLKRMCPEIKLIGLDISTRMLNGAYHNPLIHADGNKLPFPERGWKERTIFHQGLLEHLSNRDIQTMIREQLRVARYVVASVPSDRYTFPQGLRGDERLMSIPEWRAILPGKAQVDYYGQFPGEKYHILMVMDRCLS